MTEELAIRLFVAAGNPEVMWPYADWQEREAYRREAMRLHCEEKVVPAHGFEPQHPEPKSGVLPLDEAG